jgi:hypothetical protein
MACSPKTRPAERLESPEPWTSPLIWTIWNEKNGFLFFFHPSCPPGQYDRPGNFSTFRGDSKLHSKAFQYTNHIDKLAKERIVASYALSYLISLYSKIPAPPDSRVEGRVDASMRSDRFMSPRFSFISSRSVGAIPDSWAVNQRWTDFLWRPKAEERGFGEILCYHAPH